MEQLIAKSELLDCGLPDRSALLLMGKSAYFECYDDGYVGVLTESASRLPFGFGSSKMVWLGYLGSGLIDHIQKMTMAAIAMADMKVCAHRSYRVWMRRQSFSLPNMFSILWRFR
jgi:hypothetical protein